MILAHQYRTVLVAGGSQEAEIPGDPSVCRESSIADLLDASSGSGEIPDDERPTFSPSAEVESVSFRSKREPAPKRVRSARPARPASVVPFPGPALDPRVVMTIGEALRASYGHLLQQPVPDRFVALLKGVEELDKKGGP